MKCNNDVRIINTLVALGAGLDCASKAEIHAALDAGLGADKIIYANPCKPVSHLRFAHKVGVRLMTFDNEDELVKVCIHPLARVITSLLLCAWFCAMFARPGEKENDGGGGEEGWTTLGF